MEIELYRKQLERKRYRRTCNCIDPGRSHDVPQKHFPDDARGVLLVDFLPPAARAVYLDPFEDFVVPVAAVCGFVDPVAFIREVDELARDAQTLQGGEELLAFAHGDAEVEVIVDDEHRGFEIGGELVR